MAMNAMEHRKIPHIGEVYRREDNVREGEAAGREQFFQLVIDVPTLSGDWAVAAVGMAAARRKKASFCGYAVL